MVPGGHDPSGFEKLEVETAVAVLAGRSIDLSSSLSCAIFFLLFRRIWLSLGVGVIDQTLQPYLHQRRDSVKVSILELHGARPSQAHRVY